MTSVMTPGLALHIDPATPKLGRLSGAALRKPVQVRVVRQSPNGDVLATDGRQYFMVKATCIVCGEADAGKKRLEIMRYIYNLVMKGQFNEARSTFFEMQRLLL